MPVTLIVENGTGVPNANSYDTVANAIAFAANRGITLPPDSGGGQVSAWLVSGTDYLESFANQFVGRPVSFTQALSWPRQCVEFGPDNPFPSDEIPTQLIAALDQAVIAQFQGIVLMPTVDHSQGGYVIEDKVGPLITKYSEKIGTTSAPLLPAVMAQLQCLLIPGVALRTVRI